MIMLMRGYFYSLFRCCYTCCFSRLIISRKILKTRERREETRDNASTCVSRVGTRGNLAAESIACVGAWIIAWIKYRRTVKYLHWYFCRTRETESSSEITIGITNEVKFAGFIDNCNQMYLHTRKHMRRIHHAS